jgi:hypothetical protein
MVHEVVEISSSIISEKKVCRNIRTIYYGGVTWLTY